MTQRDYRWWLASRKVAKSQSKPFDAVGLLVCLAKTGVMLLRSKRGNTRKGYTKATEGNTESTERFATTTWLRSFKRKSTSMIFAALRLGVSQMNCRWWLVSRQGAKSQSRHFGALGLLVCLSKTDVLSQPRAFNSYCSRAH